MNAPNKDSNRSKRREKRQWKSLEQSSRKHRRAAKRQGIKCSIAGKSYKPGEKVQITDKGFTAGGSFQYH